jgi:hypothetical protein
MVIGKACFVTIESPNLKTIWVLRKVKSQELIRKDLEKVSSLLQFSFLFFNSHGWLIYSSFWKICQARL